MLDIIVRVAVLFHQHPGFDLILGRCNQPGTAGEQPRTEKKQNKKYCVF
jgi:hypothetical protein